MSHKVEILNKEWLTHNVMQLKVERPEGFDYEAGMAIEATLDETGFEDKWSPFTMTSLPTQNELEFTIKVYPEHEGLTLALSKLNEGESYLITDPFETFKNKGPAVFIAGGTGVTPFIALLRQLEVDDKIDGSQLFFANKKEKDIFMAGEFTRMLGKNFVNILSEEDKKTYLNGVIDKDFLKKHIDNFDRPFYLCGPPGFADDIGGYLKELGAGEDLVNVSL
jgi:ferredoxin-NADP reductase